MVSFYDRYQRGECEQVWSELTALGAVVREEPVYSDALAVARETMRRARVNIEMLIVRLDAVGYLFQTERRCAEQELNRDRRLSLAREDACRATLARPEPASPLEDRLVFLRPDNGGRHLGSGEFPWWPTPSFVARLA